MTGIFGKVWWKSLTAWGLVLLAASESGLASACNESVQLVSVATCDWMTGMFGNIGGVLTVLGLRRAAN